MEPVSWVKASSDKLNKPDNRSRKEVYNRYFDNSQRLSMGSQSQPPPLPLPTNTRTHVFVCNSIPNKIIHEKHLQLHHFTWHIKMVSAFVLVRARGFLRLNLICPIDTRAIVYNALFGPRSRVFKDCFHSLSDRRSDERCEDAGKTACELLYSQSRVGVVGSQLFRAAGNTETGFFNLIAIAFLTAWQSIINEGACQG